LKNQLQALPRDAQWQQLRLLAAQRAVILMVRPMSAGDGA
jgi:hypothetical protein